jgi:hypothetical protein
MNKALSIIALLFCVLLGGCSHRLAMVKTAPSKFEFKGKLRAVTFFEGYYYILTYGNELYRFNKNTNALDSTYFVDFDNDELSAIYVSEGSIQGESYYKYYSLKNGNWKYLRKVATEYPGNKIFEDDDYIVSSICQGEFGGMIFFKSKNNKKVYETLCTCAFDVQKLSGGYLVTSTLAHGNGFVNMYEIANPTKLPIYNSSNYKNGFRQGLTKQLANQGKVEIFHSYAQLCLGKFSSDGKAYFIIQKTEPFAGTPPQLGIYTVENDVLKLSQEIKSDYFNSAIDFWGTEHQQPFITFDNGKSTGFIDFSDGKIVFYNFPLKKQ